MSTDAILAIILMFTIRAVRLVVPWLIFYFGLRIIFRRKTRAFHCGLAAVLSVAAVAVWYFYPVLNHRGVYAPDGDASQPLESMLLIDDQLFCRELIYTDYTLHPFQRRLTVESDGSAAPMHIHLQWGSIYAPGNIRRKAGGTFSKVKADTHDVKQAILSNWRSTKPIPEKYAETKVPALQIEAIEKKGDETNLHVRLINPTSSILTFQAHGEDHPYYKVQMLQDQAWKDLNPHWFVCGTGMRTCIIPPGQSVVFSVCDSILTFSYRISLASPEDPATLPEIAPEDLPPIRVGVEFYRDNHGVPETVWSEQIDLSAYSSITNSG